jgi:regulator of RNase E activity RraA
VRGDADGVIVIPRALAAEVAREALLQEEEERFIVEQVDDGAAIDGLYPLGDTWREQFERWRERGGK